MTGTRLLGLDLGERRIGVAIADPDAGARPLATLVRRQRLDLDAASLAELVTRHDVAELVVGLPLDMRGTEGPQAVATRAWAEAIAARLGLPLTLRDERLSSHVAESRLGPPKRGRAGGPPSHAQRDARRGRIDREAAAIILQDEIDARRKAAT